MCWTVLSPVSWWEANYLVVSSVLSPRQALLSGAPGPQIEAGSFGERRSDTERTRSSRCTWSTRQRRDTSCLRWKTKGGSQLCKVLLVLNTQTKTDGQYYLSPRPPRDRWRQPVGYGGELWASPSVWIRSGSVQDLQTSWWRSPHPPPSLSASCRTPTATSKETYGATRKSTPSTKHQVIRLRSNHLSLCLRLFSAEVSFWWLI